MVIRPLLTTELEWANACYRETEFALSPPEDFIAVAELDAEKVGLGRLVRIDAETGELGGIYVLPQFRGRAVARSLVAFLLEHSEYRRLYCVPFVPLEPFYRGFGFEQPSAAHALPDPIAEKLDWCRQNAAPVLLLVRNSF